MLPLFSYGFRPFFLLTGLAAVILVPIWALSFANGTPIGSAWPPTLWHAHEMFFGFTMSAVAGFLLTAVPSWTGQRGFSGWPLLLLTALWIAARGLIATCAFWPGWLVATVDLAFLPALALLVAFPLLRARNRNTVMLLFLAILWLTNVGFHVALARKDAPSAALTLRIGIDVLLTMVTLIGGRIIPAFTTSALRGSGAQELIRSRPSLTIAALISMTLMTLSDALVPDSHVSAALAGAAALLQAARMLQWGGLRTLKQPIVWVLHLAYLWLPVGLMLKTFALFGGYAWSAFWLHALTVGALSSMILGVMTRAALGHTGRALTVSPLTVAGYGLLTLAALVRVFGLAAFPVSYPFIILLAAAFWTVAFVLFLAVYAPILSHRRVDGKPG